jgi:hypothetical protein
MKPPLAVTLYQSRRGVLSSAGTLNISPRLATKRLNTAQVASFGEIAPALDLL